MILMNKENINIEILNNQSIEALMAEAPLYIFDQNIIDFLNELSRILFKVKSIKNYPDLLTFAFYCRKSNIQEMKLNFYDHRKIQIGRGIAFHIAPSNVPMNFAYSFISGLLTGNTNIVRVPSKNFIQIKIFFQAYNKLNSIVKYKKILNRSVFVRYDRDSNATEYFSSICDSRIIWGGDNTIELIRSYKIPARANEVTFSDRFSFSVINAKKYLESNEKKNLSVAFFNDTYLFDPNACTSPHILFWYGKSENIVNAKKNFWDLLYDYVKENYEISPVTSVDKLTNYCSSAIQGVEIDLIKYENLIWRVGLKKLINNIHEYKSNSGYFFEYNIENFDKIIPIINKKYQTLSYFGFEISFLEKFVKKNNLVGIDRITQIGNTSNFSLIWDGYNLVGINKTNN